MSLHSSINFGTDELWYSYVFCLHFTSLRTPLSCWLKGVDQGTRPPGDSSGESNQSNVVVGSLSLCLDLPCQEVPFQAGSGSSGCWSPTPLYDSFARRVQRDKMRQVWQRQRVLTIVLVIAPVVCSPSQNVCKSTLGRGHKCNPLFSR